MITPSTLAKLITESNLEAFGRPEFQETERCDTDKYVLWLETLCNKLTEASKANRKKPGPKKQPKLDIPTPSTKVDFRPIWEMWLKRDSELYVPALRAFQLNVRDGQHNEFTQALINYKEIQLFKENRDPNQSQCRLSFPKFAGQWADYSVVDTPKLPNIDKESF